MNRRIAHAAQIGALVLALALVPAALAAKGGHSGTTSGSGSLSGPTMVSDANANGLPNWGDQITFNVSTSWTYYPSVEVDCSQNGALVYRQIVGFYPTYIGDPYFTLSGYWWTGGAADCTAYLDMANGRSGWTQLSSMSFHVDA